jgi:hypothetical protein
LLLGDSAVCELGTARVLLKWNMAFDGRSFCFMAVINAIHFSVGILYEL